MIHTQVLQVRNMTEELTLEDSIIAWCKYVDEFIVPLKEKDKDVLVKSIIRGLE